MRNIAIILAGGQGSRFGSSLPKQLVKLAGKTIIEHTLDVFQNSDCIDEIAIVSNPDYIVNIEYIVNNNNYFKLKKILSGGKERSDSSIAAIRAYENESDEVNLIFHDAVRPFVSLAIIQSVVEALKKYNAVDVAVVTTDTIIEIDENKFISAVPNRSVLRRSQTPQAFKLSTIRDAYDIALKDTNFQATDDCGVVLKYLPSNKIFVVEGSETNIKITYELDMFIAEKLCQLR